MQFGFTSLFTASKQGHVEVVRALLAAGTDKEAKDDVGAGGAMRGVGSGCRVYESLSSMPRCMFADRFHAPHCGQQCGTPQGGAGSFGSGR